MPTGGNVGMASRPGDIGRFGGCCSREMVPLFLACRAGRSRFAFEMKGQRLEYNLARSRGTWLVRRKIASRPDRQPNKVLAAEGLKIPDGVDFVVVENEPA